MRITHISLHTANSLEAVEFSVREAAAGNKYFVRNIVGLDAEELVPKFYSFGNVSGEAYYDHVMKPRDIVMRIAINPTYRINETVEELRDELYRLVSSRRAASVELQFRRAGTVVRSITGLITKFEVGYFNRLPELQITFHCADPTFRSLTPIQYDVDDIEGTVPVVLTDNESTAPHGMSFSVAFTATTTQFTIQDKLTNPDWFFTIIPSASFVATNVLHFSSEFGKKRIFLDATVDLHLMDKIVAGSVWPTIYPGRNEMYFIQQANFDWLSMEYYSAYWGL